MRVVTAVYGAKSISPLPISYTLAVAFHNGSVSLSAPLVQLTVKELGYPGP